MRSGQRTLLHVRLSAGLGFDARSPVPRLSVFVGDGVDLWSFRFVGLVDDRVREAIQMVDTQAEVAMRPPMLVLDQEVSHSLELSEESFSNSQACMLGVVHSRITKLGFGFGMKPVLHPSRALTRASASSPATMVVLPDLTSSRRACPTLIHAACADERGSKLASSLSTSLARSSGGRPSA